MNFYKSFGRSIEVLAFTSQCGGAPVQEQHIQMRVGHAVFSGYWFRLSESVPADLCGRVVDFGGFNGYRACVTLLRRWCAAVALEWDREAERQDGTIDSDPIVAEA